MTRVCSPVLRTQDLEATRAIHSLQSVRVYGGSLWLHAQQGGYGCASGEDEDRSVPGGPHGDYKHDAPGEAQGGRSCALLLSLA